MNDYDFRFKTKGECPHSDSDLMKLAGFMSGYGSLPDAHFNALIEKYLGSIHRIPAGFTYFGQFVDHDLSFDSRSDRTRPADRPWAAGSFDDRRNQRRQWLELETIYGQDDSGVDKYPYFRIGRTRGLHEEPSSAERVYPCDHIRDTHTGIASLVDPRNDENLIVSQLALLFKKFHNANVKRLESWESDVSKLFKRAKKTSIRHYQKIILGDYLPRIVEQERIDAILDDGRKPNQRADGTRFMPFEFAVGAFRFGHSMIRNGYDYNLGVRSPSAGPDALGHLVNMMMFTGPGGMNGNTVKGLPSLWIIDWSRFFEVGAPERLNFAERIDTIISSALLMLRPKVEGNLDGRASSLAAIDLFRGRSVGLPSGQEVADQLGVMRLSSAEFGKVFTPARVGVDPEFAALQRKFADCTPLWFYILAEAETRGGGRLGDAGAEIVAGTIVSALRDSQFSVIACPIGKDDDDISNDGEFTIGPADEFSMKDLIDFVQEVNLRYGAELYADCAPFDEVNPLGD